MRVFTNSILGFLTVLYPLIIFYGNPFLEPWKIAAILIALLSVRLAFSYSSKNWTTPLLMAGIGYSLFAMWSNQLNVLRFYPVLVNMLMLLIFGWSLFSSQTLVERIARVQHPNLPPQGIIYTRRVTQIWCCFFIVNGTIAFITTRSSLEFWSLYNGLIAYVLMGILFAAEYVVRIKTQNYVR